MNRFIKLLFPACFFLFPVLCGYAQDLDLIVTSGGDSIACRIDSITSTHLYCEMKSHGKWVHTMIPRAQVTDYKEGAISKKEVLFKPGTSLIDTTSRRTLKEVQKNSIYLGISTLMYARMIPLNQVGITVGVGLGNFDGWGVIGESSLLLGNDRHFFEPGLMVAYQFDQSHADPGDELLKGAITFRFGYRYQGYGGLLLRAAPNLIFTTDGFYFFPALSLGVSF